MKEISEAYPIEKYCWNCGKPLDYDHYIQSNNHESDVLLNDLWNSPYIQILCCSCYCFETQPLSEAQIEIKSLIQQKIGLFRFYINFGRINNSCYREEYHQTIPYKDEIFAITKGISDIECKLRAKYKYIRLDNDQFQELIDQFYSNMEVNLIMEILMEDNEIFIEISNVLSPAIFYCSNHDYRALLAPLNIELDEELENYKKMYACLMSTC